VPGKADAIVVAYLSKDILARCIRSLRDDPALGRIIVVNNSPEDGSRDVLRDFEEVVYLDSPGNVGFSRAVNSARPYVRQEYVALVNPDAVQEPGTTGSLVEFMERHPRAAAAAPRMVNPEGSLVLNSQRDLTLIRLIAQSIKGPERFRLTRTATDHSRPHSTEYVIGSFMVCRVAGLDEVDWFDERIFLFGEDLDLCRRLRQCGWEVWYAPLGRVEHSSGHSWKQLTDRGRSLFREARQRELRKSRGLLQSSLYLALVRLKDLLGRFLSGKKGSSPASGAAEADELPRRIES